MARKTSTSKKYPHRDYYYMNYDEAVERLVTDIREQLNRVSPLPMSANLRRNTVSQLVEGAVNKLARDIQHGVKISEDRWRKFAEQYMEIRASRKQRHVELNNVALAAIDIIFKHLRDQQIPIPFLFHGDAPNRKAIITLALLYVAEELEK